MTNLKIIKGNSDFESIKKASNDRFVVLEFIAPWSLPCKEVMSKFEELSSKHPNLTFARVDVDENEEIADTCEIMALPSYQLYFKGKKEKEGEFKGKDQFAKLVDFITKLK